MKKPQHKNEIGFLKDVYVRLNKNLVLENINLKIYENEFLTIIGPNGSGKTTLLKTILGIIKPTSGKVNLFGFENGRYPKGLIGYLPQHNSQNINFPAKVFDVVMMGRYPLIGFCKFPDEKDKKIVEKALRLLNVSHLKDKNFHLLSGGEKQRVLIARALSAEPKLLILDEPSVSLDIIAQKDLYEMLDYLKNEYKISIIVVSHDIGVITSYADKIACLNKKIHYYGKAGEIISSEVISKVFGKDVVFLIHDSECITCKDKNNV